MQTLDLSAKEKRKSLLLTVVIYTLFLLILFFIRFWPPSNMNEALLAGGGGGGGVTINFGNSDFGSGKDFQSEELDVKTVKNVAAASEPEEDIISGDAEANEAVNIPKKINPVKVTKPKVKIDPKPVAETKPKVNKNTNDALSSILGGSKKGGDGDDSRSGNKGKTNGSLGSNDYYGSGGSGGGAGGGTGTGNGTGTGSGSGSGSGGGSGSGSGGVVGYSLGNRKALSKPQPNYTCNEEGKVVVEVTVDQTGKTINAVAGVKGTTNTASCLLQQAKLAALNTKWQASADAPERQVGKIIYSFSLN
ncbi:energy transducer TonB [Flavobacterium amnicola]|uniref:Energy transducer TonB n=1 Tax=Flavobacterium amnicola TaxID=2506422 RepID=A0A4Q1K1B7_9FLAO|nr:energy transducer TonB [Flavobacterium amnicola]RXR17214.1 energy transducer TonB [Flavobacterium amnicola]